MSDENNSLPSASELLRAARTERDLTLEQVSQKTRIPPELILALEERRWDALPGAPYARAFSRTLAVAYELDPDLVLAGLRNDMGLRPAPSDSRAAMELRLGATEEKVGKRTPLIMGGIIGLAFLLVVAATRLVFQSGTAAVRNQPEGVHADTVTSSDTVVPTPPALPTKPVEPPPARRTATLSLIDTSKIAFVLYMRPGIRKVRKKTLSATDSLEFDPDTSILVRNLSGRPLRLTGAVHRDSVLPAFFRISRKSDSVRVEGLREDEWNRLADPIIKKNKKNHQD